MHSLAKTASVCIETLSQRGETPHLRLIPVTSPKYPKLQLGAEALKDQEGYSGFLFVRRRHQAGLRRCPTLVTLTLLAIAAAAYLVLRCRPHTEIQNGVRNATRSLAAAARAQGELGGVCGGGESGEFADDVAQDAALDGEELRERAVLFTYGLKRFFENFMLALQKVSTSMRREGMSIILALAVVELSAQATLLKVEQRHGIKAVLDSLDLLYDTLRRTFTKKQISLCGLRHLRQLRLFLEALPGIKWAGGDISPTELLRKLEELLELQESVLEQMLQGMKQLTALKPAFNGLIPDELADEILQDMRQTMIVRRFQLLRDPALNHFLREQHTERVRFGLCAFWQIQRALARPLEQHHVLLAELASTPLGLRLSQEQSEASGALQGNLESLSLENSAEPAVESADSAVLLKASEDLGTEGDSLEAKKPSDDSYDLAVEDNSPKANEPPDETYGFATENESPKADELSDCSDGFGAEADSSKAGYLSHEQYDFGAEADSLKAVNPSHETFGFGAVDSYPKVDQLADKADDFGAVEAYPKADEFASEAYGSLAYYPNADGPSLEAYGLGDEAYNPKADNVPQEAYGFGAEAYNPKADNVPQEAYGFGAEAYNPKADNVPQEAYGFGAEAYYPKADDPSQKACGLGAEAYYPKADNVSQKAYGIGAEAYYPKADNVSQKAYGIGAEAYYPKSDNVSQKAYGIGAEAYYPKADNVSQKAYGLGAEAYYPKADNVSQKAYGLGAEAYYPKADDVSQKAYGLGSEAYYPKADDPSHEAYGFKVADEYLEADELADDAYGFGLEEDFLTVDKFGNEAHYEHLYAGSGQAAVPAVTYNSLRASGLPLADDSSYRISEEPKARSDYVETAHVSLPQRPAFSVLTEAIKQFEATRTLQQAVSQGAALLQSASSLLSPYGLPRYTRPFAAPGAAEFSDKSFVFGQSGSPEKTWFVGAPAPGKPSTALGAAQYTWRLPSNPPAQYPVMRLPLDAQYSSPRADLMKQHRLEPRQQQPFPGQHLMHMTGAGSHLPQVPSERPPIQAAAEVTYGAFSGLLHQLSHPMQAGGTPALKHEAYSSHEALRGAAESRQAHPAAGLWERAPGRREPNRPFHGVPLGEPLPKYRLN
ncbi:hypothetical protein, conserved [Eimeria necatrix]|uniref:Uncharacterized protein n=1 Tax=Eimeria necatrix TaxID=51315 RepID=U6MSJ5_9EIME|nr:hypothetical protein, conserved [Eimeria necatrix]CDJ67001.1 hypothetical protein, conserved [Eimeria necatrix]